jgi:hypothetical protein
MLYSQALSAIQQYLGAFAATDDFEGSIVGIFGAGIDRSLLAQIRGELGTANGAYAAALDQVLVSGDFLRRGDLLAVAGLLLEEVGHRFDRLLNGGVDTVGDEGVCHFGSDYGDNRFL